MQIEIIEVGPYAANCYLVFQQAERKALIIDPGAEPDKIKARIRQLQLVPEAIAITHGHFDHIGAAAALATEWQIPILLHPQEAVYMRERSHPLMSMTAEVLDELLAALPQNGRYLLNGDTFEAAAGTWKAWEVAGHSDHSLCFYEDEEGILFCGDTIFAGGVGRTDLYHGASTELVRQIHAKLMVLPDETNVYPGHGPATTIGLERETNPFLQW